MIYLYSVGERLLIMAEESTNPNPTPRQDIKEKLRQARLIYNQAKKLITDIEKGHAKFVEVRNILQDKQNGVEANKLWVAKQRDEITAILNESITKLDKLETTASKVGDSVNDIDTKYTKFKPLAEQVFDKNEGLDAVLKATRRLRKATADLAKKIEGDANNAGKKLADIMKISGEVDQAYTDFTEKKNRIDDEENGFEAQLRKATEYTTSAQDAKTKSESALVSITKFKEQSDELVVQIKGNKTTVDVYEKESKTLTENIRNTLNKVTQFTLSKALQERTKSFNRQMWFWAILQVIAIAMLTWAVYLIFEVLFVGTQGHPAISSDATKPDLVSVVSKFLFTTPLIFAVYITTSNYKHARDLRDRYAWKETVAKNFQNYIKLLKDEFNDGCYDEERFRFSMDTIRNIYTEPNPLPKKKKYNFSLKTVQLNIEEEDLQQLKEVISYNIKTEVAKQGGVIEDAVEKSVAEAAESIVNEKQDSSDTTTTPTKQAVVPKKAKP